MAGSKEFDTSKLQDAMPAFADRGGTVYVRYRAKVRGSFMDAEHVAAVDANGKSLWAFRSGGNALMPLGLDSRGWLYLAGGGWLVCLAD